jgi:hypothetical protein
MNMTDMPPGFLRTSIQTDQLMPALAEARAEIGAVEKQGYNEHHKYAYTKLEDVIVAIAPALNKHGLAVSGSLTDFKIPEKKENLVIVSMTHRLTHVKSGQWIEADAIGSGADSQDKAAYKAMTGARKYGLCMLLNLMTSDDAEETSNDASRKFINADPIIAEFEKIGVGPEHISTFLHYPIYGGVAGSDANKLRGILKSIRAGTKKASEVFEGVTDVELPPPAPPAPKPGGAAANAKPGTPPENPRASVQTSPQPRRKAG